MNCLPPSSFVTRVDRLLKRTSTQPKYKEPIHKNSNSSISMDKSSIEGLRNEIKSLKSQIFNKSFNDTKTSFLETTNVSNNSTINILSGLTGCKGSARSVLSDRNDRNENSNRSLKE